MNKYLEQHQLAGTACHRIVKYPNGRMEIQQLGFGPKDGYWYGKWNKVLAKHMWSLLARNVRELVRKMESESGIGCCSFYNPSGK